MRARSIARVAALGLWVVALGGCCSPCGSSDDDAVEFADVRFEAVVREALGLPEGSAISKKAAAGLKGMLSARNRGIEDLGGIQCLVNLAYIDAEGNKITDLSPLKDHPSLNRVALSQSPLSPSELEVLHTIPNLTQISLRGVGISDFSVLSCLTRLTALDVGGNGFSSLAFAKDMTSMRRLTLDHTKVKDLGALERMADLDYLHVEGCDVEDLSPLDTLSKLIALNLSGTSVRSLEFLRKHPQLRDLRIGGLELPKGDLSLLKVCAASLQVLSMGGTGATSFQPLAGAKSLRKLYADGNPIADLAPLRDKAELTVLSIQATNVGSLEPLATAKSLKELYASGAPFADLGPLKDIATLETVYVGKCGIEDLAPLAGKKHLKKLVLTNNKIRDPSPLASLAKLEQVVLELLQIQGNRIKDAGKDPTLRLLKNKGVKVTHD